MTGMSFAPFLTLAIIGLLTAYVIYALARYRVLTGPDGFLTQWIAGWLGGWLGSPVFGHWGPHTAGIYIIPAVIGAFIGSFLFTAIFKMGSLSFAPWRAPVPAPMPSNSPAGVPTGMKKAS